MQRKIKRVKIQTISCNNKAINLLKQKKDIVQTTISMTLIIIHFCSIISSITRSTNDRQQIQLRNKSHNNSTSSTSKETQFKNSRIICNSHINSNFMDTIAITITLIMIITIQCKVNISHSKTVTLTFYQWIAVQRLVEQKCQLMSLEMSSTNNIVILMVSELIMGHL